MNVCSAWLTPRWLISVLLNRNQLVTMRDQDWLRNWRSLLQLNDQWRWLRLLVEDRLESVVADVIRLVRLSDTSLGVHHVVDHLVQDLVGPLSFRFALRLAFLLRLGLRQNQIE